MFFFADVEIVNAGYQFCVVGAYLGMIIDARKYRGTPKYAHDTSSVKALIRILATWMIMIPAFYFCSYQSQTWSDNRI